MNVTHLTLDAIRPLKAAGGGGFKQGKPALFPDKKPGIVYLTDEGRDRLKTLAQASRVSMSDFLEVLIRRYGTQASDDILAATEDNHGTENAVAADSVGSVPASKTRIRGRTRRP